MKNMSTMTMNYSTAGNLYQARMGPNSNTENPETWCPDVFKLFLKEEEMLHHKLYNGKHAPVPTILIPVAGIKFKMISFCA